MGRQKFPEFDVWRAMSEGEQDALIAKMERTRRRSDPFMSLVVAALVTAAMVVLLYLLSSQMR